MSRKTKITKELIFEAYKLSKSGFTHKQIYNALKISHTAFYANIELVDTIKRAENELRCEVANSLLEKAITGDTTLLIFLAKRLNLFSESMRIHLTSPKSALKSLEEVANANLSIEHKNSLKAIINDFIKSYEVTELEKRIEQLEKHYEK